MSIQFSINAEAEAVPVGLANAFIASWSDPGTPVASCTEGDRIVVAFHLDYETDEPATAKVSWKLTGGGKKILKGKFTERLQGMDTFKKPIYIVFDLKDKHRKRFQDGRMQGMLVAKLKGKAKGKKKVK